MVNDFCKDCNHKFGEKDLHKLNPCGIFFAFCGLIDSFRCKNRATGDQEEGKVFKLKPSGPAHSRRIAVDIDVKELQIKVKSTVIKNLRLYNTIFLEDEERKIYKLDLDLFDENKEWKLIKGLGIDDFSFDFLALIPLIETLAKTPSYLMLDAKWNYYYFFTYWIATIYQKGTKLIFEKTKTIEMIKKDPLMNNHYKFLTSLNSLLLRNYTNCWIYIVLGEISYFLKSFATEPTTFFLEAYKNNPKHTYVSEWLLFLCIGNITYNQKKPNSSNDPMIQAEIKKYISWLIFLMRKSPNPNMKNEADGWERGYPGLSAKDPLGQYEIVAEGERAILSYEMEKNKEFLFVSFLGATSPSKQKIKHRIDFDRLEHIKNEFKKITENYNQEKRITDSKDIYRNLEENGKTLFTLSLPSVIQEQLTQNKVELVLELLSQELYPYPWELLYDGENFLGLKCGIGRIFRARTTPKSRKVPPPQSIDQFKILLIGNPCAGDPVYNLPGAQKEVDKLNDHLEKIGFQVKTFSGSQATYENIIRAFQEGFDFIHYAGHVRFNLTDPDKSYILLFHGEKFYAHQIQNLRSPTIHHPILAFINACESGQDQKPNQIHYQDQVSGLAMSFLNNEINYIGTLWAVQDELATALALNFYSNLLNEKSIGESLRLAKMKIIETYGIEEITWASYILYGTPTLTLKRRH